MKDLYYAMHFDPLRNRVERLEEKEKAREDFWMHLTFVYAPLLMLGIAIGIIIMTWVRL